MEWSRITQSRSIRWQESGFYPAANYAPRKAFTASTGLCFMHGNLVSSHCSFGNDNLVRSWRNTVSLWLALRGRRIIEFIDNVKISFVFCDASCTALMGKMFGRQFKVLIAYRSHTHARYRTFPPGLFPPDE